MAYNKELAARVRTALVDSSAITEKKTFGGLSFLLGGKMCCGVIDDNLVVRVGPDGYEDAPSPTQCTSDGLHGPANGRVGVCCA